ncbi:hypothetical protein Lalb_Chr23g0274021 [Lupinus albus]|uniref:Uncharacterized protein n=1 Tax=Lupinus albus TaxID=3870 RepID=A0A6A4N9E6_LUPAL|nr:hypothetical protein Lalb_Chr23g0274021 [Lupinus albus]
MLRYFGSSYVVILWLKLCSDSLAQVMKRSFGSNDVANFGSSDVAKMNLKMIY